MHLGVSPYGLRVGDYVELAGHVEAAGLESFWVPDHLAVPERIVSSFPYSSDGDSGMRPDTEMFDAWVLLSFIAAATSSLRLGTYVYVLPLRHPFVTAKAAGSLQILSGHRALLGIGAGWLAEEVAAMDEDLGARGARTSEAIDVMRALWSQDVVGWTSRHYELPPSGMAPRPGRVPIHVGGHSKAALRRAARSGDHWLGSARPPEILRGHLDEVVPALERALAEAGRSRDGFGITSAVLGAPAGETLAQAAEAGLDRLIVAPWAHHASPPSLVRAAEDLNTIAVTAKESL